MRGCVILHLNIKPHDQHITILSIDFGHYRQEPRLSGFSVVHEDDFAVDGVLGLIHVFAGMPISNV